MIFVLCLRVKQPTKQTNKDFTRKKTRGDSCGEFLVQAQSFGIDTRYCHENLHQLSKKVKTKSQKVLGANSYVCRSYSEKN